MIFEMKTKKNCTRPTILVTGGAGYIGSHTVHALSEQGYNVIVLDTFVHNQTVPASFKIKSCFSENFFPKKNIVVLKKDFSDQNILADIFMHYNIAAVMHFAACIEVGESVKNPRLFYHNNVVKTVRLLESMLTHGVKQFIFSSSCAVYGIPKKVPITEDHPKNPISPYGKNKLIVEMALEDFAKAYNFRFVSLRYFNAAGALPQYGLGEQHKPETHLIPLLFDAAHQEKPFYIFGNDYPTPDGTCVRDFLHVQDLATAHIQAVEYLAKGGTSDAFNLGTGNGFSVKEIIEAVKAVSGKSIKTIVTEKREGDPPALIADPTKAQKKLYWQARNSGLHAIIASAHQFYTQSVLIFNQSTNYAKKQHTKL